MGSRGSALNPEAVGGLALSLAHDLRLFLDDALVLAPSSLVDYLNPGTEEVTLRRAG
jgi:hypothetical protein